MLKVICDNKAAIDTIGKLKDTPSTTKHWFEPDADIIQEILKITRRLKN
jgi:hypothetical protein